jgi:uncharacterized protein (TIGR02186 family)
LSRWPPLRRHLGLAATLVALTLLGPASSTRATATELVADLSEHLIAITTAFVGTTVVLFGAHDGVGDIAVTVHGPRVDEVVRRKSRVAGIWINREELTFQNVPDYYAVASSQPLPRIAPPDVRARHELGLDFLRLDPRRPGIEIGELTAYRDALIRNKQRQGLYSVEPGVVRFLGERLFRTSLAFPANVPPGIYQVQVFEIQDGVVTDAQRSTLVISKVGLEADLFDFAMNRSALYGIVAVVLAVTSGWLANVIFRRG